MRVLPSQCITKQHDEAPPMLWNRSPRVSEPPHLGDCNEQHTAPRVLQSCMGAELPSLELQGVQVRVELRLLGGLGFRAFKGIAVGNQIEAHLACWNLGIMLFAVRCQHATVDHRRQIVHRRSWK